jgi:molybdate transport system substrate-binding protein
MNASTVKSQSTSRIAWLLSAIVGLGACSCTSAADDPPAHLLVFAAASLTDALGEIGAEYETRMRRSVTFSFAASSVLARQIEAGARADLFVSADEEWMDYLQQRGLVAPQSRRDIAGNRLVLIALAESDVRVDIDDAVALGAALGSGRLSIADPDIVPAGRYARASLEKLGAWKTVEGRLARAENVRVALAYVARGEAPLGIVYATDARIEPRVRVVAAFPASSHPPIRYPAALTRSASAHAADLLDFIVGPRGRAILARHGFTTPE